MHIADSHSDYLAYRVLGSRSGHVFDQGGVERLQKGGVVLQNLAIWAPPDAQDALSCSLSGVFALFFMAQEMPDVRLCTQPEHLSQPGLGFILSLESGESIGCNAERIEQFYGYGARMMSLTWNYENKFASGALSEGGIKPPGREALLLLNRLHMAFDVSHLNEKSFREALDIYECAPCASHSCAYDLCPNPRNLKKEQISAIIERSGYIGINFFPEFLTGGEATARDVVNHIEYIMRCGGEDTVGLGSDFCGISSTPKDLKSASDFQNIPAEMERRGFTRTLIEKICYGNFARYILQFLKHGTDESI
jgi:membrane dipeptidase